MTKTYKIQADDGLSSPLYRIIFLLPMDIPERKIEIISEALGDMALASSYFKKKTPQIGPWTVEWLVDFTPDRKEIIEIIEKSLSSSDIIDFDVNEDNLSMESVIQTDWLKQCYQQFQPFEVGGFYIYGSHYEGTINQNLTGLQIDAATAFGSGEHGTTKGCLLALEKLVGKNFKPNNILDMGSGSGILAIAGYKRYKVPTLAVDNDRESVRVTAIHRNINNIPEDAIKVVYGNGYKCDEVQNSSGFNLIFANILAGPLKDMAFELANCLTDDGYAILSGMLEEQANDVLAEHEKLGLKLIDRINIDGWSTLTIKK